MPCAATCLFLVEHMELHVYIRKVNLWANQFPKKKFKLHTVYWTRPLWRPLSLTSSTERENELLVTAIARHARIRNYRTIGSLVCCKYNGVPFDCLALHWHRYMFLALSCAMLLRHSAKKGRRESAQIELYLHSALSWSMRATTNVENWASWCCIA